MPRKTRGEIVRVGDLFEKYKKTLRAPQNSVIQAFCEVVEDLSGFVVKKDHVSYSVATKTLAISGSGMLKTEILLQKEEILTHLKGRLGERDTPKDII